MRSITRRWTGAACLLLGAAFAGCGGGDFAEAFVKLISARFVTPTVTLARGETRLVELEISCDRAGLDTPFGRLAVQVRLDPEHRLPAGVRATPIGSAPDPQTGLSRYGCNDPTGNADLLVGHVDVALAIDPAAAVVGSFTLDAYVQIEPLDHDQPSKDSTTAELVVSVGAPSTPGGTTTGGASELVR